MILSILTLYEYNPDLFDQLQLPADMDRTLQIETICAELAELDVLYSDPVMLKKLIGIWSARQLDSWEKLFATTQFEYDPIANVDGTTTTQRSYGKKNTRTPNLTHTRTVDLTNTRTADLTNTRTANLTDTESPGTVVTEAVKGYNSDTWADSRKNTESGSGTLSRTGTDTYKDTGTDTHRDSGTDTLRDTGTDVSEDSGTDTETVTRKGNIGVTTTQAMIREERDIDNFDMYLYICDAFKNQFCLQVY